MQIEYNNSSLIINDNADELIYIILKVVDEFIINEAKEINIKIENIEMAEKAELQMFVGTTGIAIEIDKDAIILKLKPKEVF